MLFVVEFLGQLRLSVTGNRTTCPLSDWPAAFWRVVRRPRPAWPRLQLISDLGVVINCHHCLQETP